MQVILRSWNLIYLRRAAGCKDSGQESQLGWTIRASQFLPSPSPRRESELPLPPRRDQPARKKARDFSAGAASGTENIQTDTRSPLAITKEMSQLQTPVLSQPCKARGIFSSVAPQDPQPLIAQQYLLINRSAFPCERMQSKTGEHSHEFPDTVKSTQAARRDTLRHLKDVCKICGSVLSHPRVAREPQSAPCAKCPSRQPLLGGVDGEGTLPQVCSNCE